MKALTGGVFLLIVVFCSFCQAFDDFWWQKAGCVAPRSSSNLYIRASEDSEIIIRVESGQKLPVVYGKVKFIFSDGKLWEEKWYEIVIPGGKTTNGWIKAKEVKECYSIRENSNR